jgi:hypothetical protein
MGFYRKCRSSDGPIGTVVLVTVGLGVSNSFDTAKLKFVYIILRPGNLEHSKHTFGNGFIVYSNCLCLKKYI